MKAIWKDTILAQSDNTVVIEGNHYFPPDSVNKDLLTPSSTTTSCPWKGEAAYYDIHVGDAVNPDAAWTYKNPSEAAAKIKNHIAFWNGVEVSD